MTIHELDVLCRIKKVDDNQSEEYYKLLRRRNHKDFTMMALLVLVALNGFLWDSSLPHNLRVSLICLLLIYTLFFSWARSKRADNAENVTLALWDDYKAHRDAHITLIKEVEKIRGPFKTEKNNPHGSNVN